LHVAQQMPLPLTVSKIQIGFYFLVPAHLGSPGKRAVKRVCVCVCVCVFVFRLSVLFHVLAVNKAGVAVFAQDDILLCTYVCSFETVTKIGRWRIDV